jgi:hypothetical protein
MTSYLREKYGKIEVDARIIQKLVKILITPGQNSYAEELEKPFEKDEIYQAYRAGGQRKAPGVDGIGLAFYLGTWNVIQEDMVDILNQIFWSGNITPQQKLVIVIFLPKGQNVSTPKDYRPITLLNEDYKLLGENDRTPPKTTTDRTPDRTAILWRTRSTNSARGGNNTGRDRSRRTQEDPDVRVVS